MKNWKTTLAGALAGVMIFIGGALKDRQVDSNAPPVTFGNILPAVTVALLGLLAKSYDVTGGSVMQPTPPAVLKEQVEEKNDAGVKSTS